MSSGSDCKIIEQLGSLQNGFACISSLQIVNLGVSIAGFAMFHHKLNNIGKEIDKLSNKIDKVSDYSESNHAMQLSAIYSNVINFGQQYADYAVANDKESRKYTLCSAYNDLCKSQIQLEFLFKDKRILKSLLFEESNDLSVLFDLFTIAGNGIVNFNVVMDEKMIAINSAEKIKKSINNVVRVFVGVLRSRAIGNDFIPMGVLPEFKNLIDNAVEIDNIFEGKIIYLKENFKPEVLDFKQSFQLGFEYAQMA